MPYHHVPFRVARNSFGTLLLSLWFLSGVSHAQSSKPAAPLTVEVAQPTKGSVNRWVSLPGSVKPLEEVVLYAKVAGYLKSISVDKGDSVKAGATLAELETPELSADVTRYRAENEAAKVEFERMQQAVKQAPDLVMPVELDRARGKYEVAKANLERIQTLLGFSRITAPFSGIITRRFADVGAFIPAATSGSAAQNAAIVTLTNFSTVRVQVAVPEADASLVSRGLPARFRVEGLPERRFEGKVSRFAYALDENNKTMLVEIDIPNPSLELRPGMYATAQLALQRHDNVLLIPVSALVMEKANAFTYTVNGASAKKRPLKIGFNDGKMVEVQEGIAVTDTVILAGKSPMSDGLAIQVATK